MRILIVEDEQRIIEILTKALSKAGFIVDAVNTAADGVMALEQLLYDAIILDLGLPDDDGLSVLKKLRAKNWDLPVLILTARDSVADRVTGLDLGADDYLVKPFATEELISRIKAMLRRPGGALGNVLQAGNITLDTVGRDVKIGDQGIALPRREIAILEHLMRRLGRVVPRDVLESKLYSHDDELESNAVQVHIHHLRRKLEKYAASSLIHTVRGVGYILTEEKK